MRRSATAKRARCVVGRAGRSRRARRTRRAASSRAPASARSRCAPPRCRGPLGGARARGSAARPATRPGRRGGRAARPGWLRSGSATRPGVRRGRRRSASRVVERSPLRRAAARVGAVVGPQPSAADQRDLVDVETDLAARRRHRVGDRSHHGRAPPAPARAVGLVVVDDRDHRLGAGLVIAAATRAARAASAGVDDRSARSMRAVTTTRPRAQPDATRLRRGWKPSRYGIAWARSPGPLTLSSGGAAAGSRRRRRDGAGSRCHAATVARPAAASGPAMSALWTPRRVWTRGRTVAAACYRAVRRSVQRAGAPAPRPRRVRSAATPARCARPGQLAGPARRASSAGGQIAAPGGQHPEQRRGPLERDREIAAVDAVQDRVGTALHRRDVTASATPATAASAGASGAPARHSSRTCSGFGLRPLAQQVQRPQRAGQADRVAVAPQRAEGVDAHPVDQRDEAVSRRVAGRAAGLHQDGGRGGGDLGARARRSTPPAASMKPVRSAYGAGRCGRSVHTVHDSSSGMTSRRAPVPWRATPARSWPPVPHLPLRAAFRREATWRVGVHIRHPTVGAGHVRHERRRQRLGDLQPRAPPLGPLRRGGHPDHRRRRGRAAASRGVDARGRHLGVARRREGQPRGRRCRGAARGRRGDHPRPRPGRAVRRMGRRARRLVLHDGARARRPTGSSSSRRTPRASRCAGGRWARSPTSSCTPDSPPPGRTCATGCGSRTGADAPGARAAAAQRGQASGRPRPAAVGAGRRTRCSARRGRDARAALARSSPARATPRQQALLLPPAVVDDALARERGGRRAAAPCPRCGATPGVVYDGLAAAGLDAAEHRLARAHACSCSPGCSAWCAATSRCRDYRVPAKAELPGSRGGRHRSGVRCSTRRCRSCSAAGLVVDLRSSRLRRDVATARRDRAAHRHACACCRRCRPADAAWSATRASSPRAGWRPRWCAGPPPASTAATRAEDVAPRGSTTAAPHAEVARADPGGRFTPVDVHPG